MLGTAFGRAVRNRTSLRVQCLMIARSATSDARLWTLITAQPLLPLSHLSRLAGGLIFLRVPIWLVRVSNS